MPARVLTILGSTGSIGANTLDVVRQNPERFQVFALVAGRNIELLARQIEEFRPKVAVVQESQDVDRLRALIPKSGDTELFSGENAAVCKGKRIGLANKEVLVSGGKIVMDAVKRHGTELIPVDSEHNGAHQCLRAGLRREATKLILTASGGPFRITPREALDRVTPADALNHPTWKMGNRITIDSATLMNKGFEVIEAHWLFDFAPADIEVVVHPQSTVHAMVEYEDGTVIAQVSATDMRMPIQYALTWPERSHAPVPKIDWRESRKWEFHAPDFDKFPLLGLAYESLRMGGSASCILNAADEVAVGAFLEGRISFPAIARVVAQTLEAVPHREPASVAEVLETDEMARRMARTLIDANRVTFAPAAVSSAQNPVAVPAGI
jgi:1-deoxy-D-xylulose-5-phosphate reductoisomerase